MKPRLRGCPADESASGSSGDFDGAQPGVRSARRRRGAARCAARAAATSSSWVTRMIVLPSRFSRSSSARISCGGDGIEVARRFVGEDVARIVDQAAGDGGALLLAAGELRRAMVEAVAEPDEFGEFAAARALSGVTWPW